MAQQAKFEDSNIALLGSDIEKNVKLNAAKCEPEWRGAGQQVGLEVWRVEKFLIKRVPPKDHGTFYTGDSYIILWTYKKAGNEKLWYNAHFWLGKNTTQDEAGTAAYKTVELDTLLRDVPVQYREVQGFESSLFFSYFPRKQFLEGGVDSGFNHVAPEKYSARLLHFKGKKNIRIIQVPLNRSSLNEGDVFLLDAGLKLWLWRGKNSGPFERLKGNEILDHLKTERDSKPAVKQLEQDDDDAEFWKMLGGKGPIASAAAGGDDLEAERKAGDDTKLYRLNDQKGLTLEGSGRFSYNQLDARDVFLLDTGIELFLWVGKGASQEERSKSMLYAIRLLSTMKKPATTPITRLVQGGETDTFKTYFQGGQIQNADAAPPARAPGAESSNDNQNSSCCLVS